MGTYSPSTHARQPLPPLRHHPVQHAQVQMHVRIQGRAKTVHKQHPAAAAHCRRACARSRCRALHFAQRDPRHTVQAACSMRSRSPSKLTTTTA